MIHLCRLIVVVAVLCDVSVFAATTGPTTREDDDVAQIRTVLRNLNQALTDGKISAITELFFAASELEQRMVDADARMAAALADMHRTSVAAYGTENAKLITGDVAGGASASLNRIDTAIIKPQGDSATVTYPDQKDPPFILKKVQGQWRIPITQSGIPVDARAVEQRLTDLARQRQVVEEITRQIRSSKFDTAEQAREAWRSRILQAATSRPTEPKK